MNSGLNFKLEKKEKVTCPNISPALLPPSAGAQLNHSLIAWLMNSERLQSFKPQAVLFQGSFLAFLLAACNRI